ncbi:MAG: glycosyltransferase [Planctomycetota bacterium]
MTCRHPLRAAAGTVHVTYFVPQFPVLSQTYVLAHIVGLIESGHEVHVVAQQRGSEADAMHADIARYALLGERTTFLPAPPGGWFARLSRVRRLARGRWGMVRRAVSPLRYGSHGPSWRFALTALNWPRELATDVVLAHFGPAGNLAVQLRDVGAIAASVPIVTMFHGADIRRAQQRGPRIYRALIRRGDCVLAICRYNREQLTAFGFDAARIVDHAVGIVPAAFEVARTPASDGTLRLLTVARLSDEKGIDVAIRALAQLPDRERIRWTIVGDGPQRGELQQLAVSAGVAGQMHFVGALPADAIPERLAAADLFVLPSRAEITPVTLMEAGASSLASIATRVGGVRDIVLDGRTGLLVPPDDAAALGDAIRTLAADPARREALGAAAREHIVQHHNLARLNDTLANDILPAAIRQASRPA